MPAKATPAERRIIPAPVQITPSHSDAACSVAPGASIAVDPQLWQQAYELRSWLEPALGGPLRDAGADTHPDILLELDTELGPEGYRLTVGPADGIVIRGGNQAGVFYGLQTLRQLGPDRLYRRAHQAPGPIEFSPTDITDRPRFAHRGLLIDVARHFFTKAEVMRIIDLMAIHKLNRLHLHLSDDQGWRVEIRAYPRLTEVGSWRNGSMVGPPHYHRFDETPHGGFFTQQDIRELVAYAAARAITIVPEIDFPAHVQAILAAYPELGYDRSPAVGTDWVLPTRVLRINDETLTFARTLLAEICDLFDSEVICIGGDECPTKEWESDPAIAELIEREGLAGVGEVQGWFTGQLAHMLAEHGRRAGGWDELVASNAPRETLIYAWRGNEATATAAVAGYDTIVAPNEVLYLDHRADQSMDEPFAIEGLGPHTLRDVYDFEPIPTELGATDPAALARIRGVQCQLWAELIDSARRIDYQLFPRLVAFAERAWSPGGGQFEEFARRLAEHQGRLDAFGVEGRPGTGPHPWQRRPGPLGAS